ncbi:MAG: folate family ECF transporter S component [Ruminococcus sp.]|jgi:ECF transporter S component (folate family)|nr:folate family ECF transporter S component [Ruminococcus sp.]
MFLKSFRESFKEFKSVYALAVMGLLIGISMVLETFTISLPMFKINFSFLAVASIGMLFGPVVGIFGGMLSDVLGWVVHPDGPFLPLYTLVGGLQGFIYGYVLYHKNGNSFGKNKINTKSEKLYNRSFVIKVVVARLLDVVVVNMFINTYLNIHYGFIPYESMALIITSRGVKNLLEFVVDVPMLLVVLPAAFVAYRRVVKKRLEVSD